VMGWIGFDLDGTIAEYHGWVSIEHIGDPIKPMIDLMKQLLSEGRDVRIFTARTVEGPVAIRIIQEWCLAQGLCDLSGRFLPVTNIKDFGCERIYDDRAVQVIKNQGATLESELAQVKRERDCYLSALTEYHCPGSMYGLAGNRSWCVGLLCCNHETQASWKKMAARCWVLQKWEWYLEAARAATEGK